jgi:hypothetical protein
LATRLCGRLACVGDSLVWATPLCGRLPCVGDSLVGWFYVILISIALDLLHLPVAPFAIHKLRTTASQQAAHIFKWLHLAPVNPLSTSTPSTLLLHLLSHLQFQLWQAGSARDLPESKRSLISQQVEVRGLARRTCLRLSVWSRGERKMWMRFLHLRVRLPKRRLRRLRSMRHLRGGCALVKVRRLSSCSGVVAGRSLRRTVAAVMMRRISPVQPRWLVTNM